MPDQPTEALPRLSPRELKDTGLLQEVNRRFLHPLGLALTIAYDEDGDIDDAELFIQDARSDPEGFYFADEGPEEARRMLANAERFGATQVERHKTRLERLGYVVQPLEEPRE